MKSVSRYYSFLGMGWNGVEEHTHAHPRTPHTERGSRFPPSALFGCCHSSVHVHSVASDRQTDPLS